LNIIEWGPGIYGIGPAAQHYFGRDPSELTPKEAAFLATIIPNPIKYHSYYRHGALSEVWERRVRELLVKMRDRGVLDEVQFAEADETPIVFASKETKD
jgi:membrane peptidoglycan carboxypeptidase